MPPWAPLHPRRRQTAISAIHSNRNSSQTPSYIKSASSFHRSLNHDQITGPTAPDRDAASPVQGDKSRKICVLATPGTPEDSAARAICSPGNDVQGEYWPAPSSRSAETTSRKKRGREFFSQPACHVRAHKQCQDELFQSLRGRFGLVRAVVSTPASRVVSTRFAPAHRTPSAPHRAANPSLT